MVLGTIGVSWYGFRIQGILLDGSFGIVGLLGLYGFLSYTNYVREEVSRRRIRNILVDMCLQPLLISWLNIPGN